MWILSISLVLLSASLLLLALTCWNVLTWQKVIINDGPTFLPTVSILIPARNEEQNLAACLEGALAQSSDVSEILVYDDHSADKTQFIASDYERNNKAIRLVHNVPLADGWIGKSFACEQLANNASGQWLLFLDADARLQPGAVRSALAEAEKRGLSLLSCWPRLELVSFWERLLMPMLNFVVFTLYPAPLAVNRSDPSLGLAHGSFMLARRDVYQKLEGHKLVRAELFEDTRLAQAWREFGERSLCLDGQNLISVRMYQSFREIWEGFQKNFFPAFKSVRSFAVFMGLHSLVFFLPFLVLPLLWTINDAWPFAVIVLVVLLMRVLLSLRFRHPLWSVLLHPLAEAVLIALGISSWLAARSGRGVQWKGRSYVANKAGDSSGVRRV